MIPNRIKIIARLKGFSDLDLVESLNNRGFYFFRLTLTDPRRPLYSVEVYKGKRNALEALYQAIESDNLTARTI